MYGDSSDALDHARQLYDVGSVLLTVNAPSAKYGEWALCYGDDQLIRGKDSYKYEGTEKPIVQILLVWDTYTFYRFSDSYTSCLK